MYIVLGATGHVGSSVAGELLGAGEQVVVVTRDEQKAHQWRSRGADTAVLDIADVEALRATFRRGRRAFLLNPPAPVSTDTDAEEHRTAAAIVEALAGSGLEKVVAQSTYGAQPGERCGDLSSLYDFEQALAGQPIPVTVLRAAYYMSNWAAMIEPARQGVLPTMIPADMRLPMVAPTDLGADAARLLRETPDQTGIRYAEGPDHYAPADVATAFAEALGTAVRCAETPRHEWEAAYRKLGFSDAAADSYARMTAASVDDGFDLPSTPERGATTLEDYIRQLVAEDISG